MRRIPKPDKPLVSDIQRFFADVFRAEVYKDKGKEYRYAEYRKTWLRSLGLDRKAAPETIASRTTKKLQEILEKKYKGRIKKEALVAEGMTFRFEPLEGIADTREGDEASKYSKFDILDTETGSVYEISLSDAWHEFFKDVLKALLDARVKRLYICMRNHKYKGYKKSGYIKVRDSVMVQQYISLARLYKLDIYLIDICPACNDQERSAG